MAAARRDRGSASTTARIGGIAVEQTGASGPTLLSPTNPPSTEALRTEAAIEQVKNPRLERIFTPIPTIADRQDKLPQVSYDHLFLKDEAEYQQALADHAYDARKRQIEKLKYSVVTEESQAQAAERIKGTRRQDVQINDILTAYEQIGEKDPHALVDAVRTDPDLRYALGSYLYQEKLPRRMHLMPDRVVSNSGKNPNHRGYSYLSNHFTSREYAVLLALAMLDGSYSDAGPHDPIERRPSGTVISGQHRAAAEELLY